MDGDEEERRGACGALELSMELRSCKRSIGYCPLGEEKCKATKWREEKVSINLQQNDSSTSSLMVRRIPPPVALHRRLGRLPRSSHPLERVLSSRLLGVGVLESRRPAVRRRVRVVGLNRRGLLVGVVRLRRVVRLLVRLVPVSAPGSVVRVIPVALPAPLLRVRRLLVLVLLLRVGPLFVVVARDLVPEGRRLATVRVLGSRESLCRGTTVCRGTTGRGSVPEA